MRFRDSDPASLRALDHVEWAQVLSFFDPMHLTLAFGERCRDHLPDWVRTRIDKNLADNIEHLRRLKNAYLEIKEALYRAGVEHLVLKGFAQGSSYAKNPYSRMQSDLDLYCPSEFLLGTRDALSGLGFVSAHLGQYLLSDQHLPKMFRPTNWQWRGNYFDPEIPISVDIHGRFWNATTARFGPSDLDQFWERQVGVLFEDVQFFALNSCDSLAFACLHMLRHALSRNLLTNHVYEIAWFLHQSAQNEEFWEHWSTTHDASLRSLEAIAFRFAKDWFACDLSPQAQEEVSRLSPVVQRWFRHYVDSPMHALFRPNKQTLWLHLALVESPRDRRVILYHGLLPTGIPPLAAFDSAPETGQGGRLAAVRKVRRYFQHILSRARYHGSVLPNTIWHGIRWWLSSVWRPV